MKQYLFHQEKSKKFQNDPKIKLLKVGYSVDKVFRLVTVLSREGKAGNYAKIGGLKLPQVR